MLKNRPLPTITEDTKRFWDSCHERAAELQECNDCSKFRFYPGPICHYCGSDAFTWKPISGKGTVWACTVLERAKGNPFENDTPIVIAVIRLAEGPYMMSNIMDADSDGGPEIGTPVAIDYEDISDEVTLPVFRING